PKNARSQNGAARTAPRIPKWPVARRLPDQHPCIRSRAARDRHCPAGLVASQEASTVETKHSRTEPHRTPSTPSTRQRRSKTTRAKAQRRSWHPSTEDSRPIPEVQVTE